MTNKAISKTGQKNILFSTFDQSNDYKRLDVVAHEGSIYQANDDMPAGTSFVEGNVGFTWQKLIVGGNAVSEFGSANGNMTFSNAGEIIFSSEGTANVMVIDGNGVTITGNLALEDISNLQIGGGNAGEVMVTDGNGTISFVSLGGAIASNGINTTGNITTTGTITSNTITVTETLTGNVANLTTVNTTGNLTTGGSITSNTTITANGNITSNGTVSGNAITSNTTITANGNITSNGTVSGNAITSNTTITANGNITSNSTITGNAMVSNTSTTGNLTVTGNAQFGDVGNLSILGGNAGEVLTTDGTGNLYWSSGSANGTSGVTTNASNVTMVVSGNTIQVIDANGTTTTGNANVTGNITATETITGNTIVSNVANLVTLNITGDANLGDAANLTILGGNAGEVLTTDGSGNVYWSSGSANGTSGVTTNAGNVTMVVGGNTIQLVDANGTTTTGNANVSGNVNAGNITTNGTVTTQTLYSNTTIMANGNIMSNGAVIGNIIQGNTANFTGNLTSGNITSNGSITGNTVIANTANIVTVNSNTVTANTITGGNISGNGAGLSNITGANVVGNVPSAVLANFANFAGNVTVNAQPNITSVGTLAGLSVGGHIIPDTDITYDLGNATNRFRDLWLSDSTLRIGNASLSSNGGNIVMSAIIANTVNTTNLAATGTSTLNIVTADIVTANYFVGNGNSLSNINGANVIGTVPVANFANFAGNVTVNAQPNITSVGTLNGLTVVGRSNLGPVGNVVITGGTSGQLLVTDGNGSLSWTTISTSGASNGTSGSQVNAGNVTTVIGGNTVQVIDANGTTTTGNANVSGNITANGNITGNYIIGNGSQLTAINGANVTGTVANANYAAYAGNVTIAAQANITSVGNLTSLTVAGNSTLGSNANVKITGGSSGQALFTDGAGNLSWTTVSANTIFSGNSNVAIPAANGNVNISASGNANVVVVTGNGLNVTGKTSLSNTLTISSGGAQITGDMSLNGNLNVVGNVNYNNVAQLVIGDPLIFIASNNATDVVDSGLVSTYNAGTYTGVARNKNNGTWTVYDSLANIPVSTIDWANSSLGKFSAGNTTVTGLTATGNVTLGTIGNVHIAGGSSGQLLSTDGTGGLSWVSVSGGANYIANGVSNLQFTSAGGNLIGAVDGTANSFFLSPTVFSAKALSIILGQGNASTMTAGVEYRIAIGSQAGDTGQATNTVAIGNAAGKSSQSANTVAVGSGAGQTSQGFGGVAIGSGAARQNQSANAVAIGTLAGYSTQGANAVAIGTGAGAVSQHADTIILNATGANLNSGVANSFYVNPVRTDASNITNYMFYNTTTKEVTYAPVTAPTPTSIANGTSNLSFTGSNGNIKGYVGGTQVMSLGGSYQSVALGPDSGTTGQGSQAVAIGERAGQIGQTSGAVAIGSGAGMQNQNSTAVAIGQFAGQYSQGVRTVAIGYNAGSTGQGENSIAIGASAANNNQHTNTIFINATGSPFQTTTTDGFYVAPVRFTDVPYTDTGSTLFYNNATKEIRHGHVSRLWGGSNTKINIESFNGNMVFTGGSNVNVMTITNTAVNFSATANLGAVSNVKMSGGVSGQVLVTDGAGNLSFATPGAATGSNMANYAANVTGAAQPNITSVGTLTSLTVSGNVSGGNITTTGIFTGNGGALSNIPGANVVGNVTSAVTANFANFAGNVTVAAQPNITSVGTLTSLTVTGNTTSGNLTTTGTVSTANLTATSNVSLGFVSNVHMTGGTSGQFLQTDGAGTLSWATVSLGAASNISNGTSNVGIDTLNGNVAVKVNGTPNVAVFGTSGLSVTGNVTASGVFTGNGAGLTNIVGSNFANFAGNVTVAAQPNITSVGTLTSLTVSGVSNIGAVGNIKITGGANGQFLQTNGTGNLAWASAPISTQLINGNSNAGFPVTNGPFVVYVEGKLAAYAGANDNATLGRNAGGNLGFQVVAIGGNAGATSQGSNAVAVGAQSGRNAQGNGAIAIGVYAGYTYQGSNSIAIGANAGAGTGQANNTIILNATGDNLTATTANSFVVAPIRNAIASNAVYYDPTTKEMTYGTPTAVTPTSIAWGSTSIGIDSINGEIIGSVAGSTSLLIRSTTTAIGRLASASVGYAPNSVSIGSGAGSYNNAGNTVTIGAGAVTQGAGMANIVVIGAGTMPTGGVGDGAVVIGAKVTSSAIGANSIAIGFNSINANAAAGTITLNATGTPLASATTSAFYVNPVRNDTGNTANVLYYNATTKEVTYAPPVSASPISIVNGTSFITIGTSGGNIEGNIFGQRALYIGGGYPSSPGNIAIGQEAGNSNQSSGAIAIGKGSGKSFQNSQAIAIGEGAGAADQRGSAIAIGAGSASNNQGQFAIAIGQNSATSGQGNAAISIGRAATSTNQGANSISIGSNAVGANQSASSIVFNATGTAITANVANAFYVRPIRSDSSSVSNELYYNTTTSEITYATSTTPRSFGPINEAFTGITAATGVVAHDCASSQIFNHSSISANFTVNLTNLSVAVGQATVITLMLNQGATAYISNALQIAGTAQTIKWQGGTAPTGNANKLDAVAFTIFRTATSTYTVTGQLVSYG